MSDPAHRQREKGVINAAHAHDTWRELAGRENEGLEITLLWSKSADRLKVAIADAKLDEQFEFVVAGAEALAAFYHPFAYAAGQDVRFGDSRRDAVDLQPQSLRGATT